MQVIRVPVNNYRFNHLQDRHDERDHIEGEVEDYSPGLVARVVLYEAIRDRVVEPLCLIAVVFHALVKGKHRCENS